MPSAIVPVTSLVIPNGQTSSNILYADKDFGDADGLTIYAPTTMPETVTLQVSYQRDPATVFLAYQGEGSTDITMAAAKARSIVPPVFQALKLVAGGAVGAERVFQVTKSMPL